MASGVLVALVGCGFSRSAWAVDLADPGIHAWGTYDFDVPRPGGGTFRSRLYYPATVPGVSTPFDPSGGPYPVISFGHGWLQTNDRYSSTFEHLASHGYFLIAPNTQTGLIPDQVQFRTDMIQSLDYMVAQGTTPSSPYFGSVDVTSRGLSGHSMGGAASIAIAAGDPTIRAVANMAAANILANPSVIEMMASVTSPINLLSGSDDLIAPPDVHQVPMYNNGGAPKMLTSLEGGCHAYFQDSGPAITDGSTMSRADQLEHTRRELVTYFNFYLKEDESLWREVWGPEAFTDPLVDVTAASGIGVSSNVGSQSVFPGETGTFDLTITNSGRSAAYYDLFAEDQAWDTSFSMAATALLNPGESAIVSVYVTPPSDAFALQDQVLISARSSADGLTRGWTMLATTTPEFNEGDVDGDGDADFQDFLALQVGYGITSGAARTDGDLDDDGDVDFQDFLYLQANFGGDALARLADGGLKTAAVPEPSATLLAAIGLVIVSIRRIRKLTARSHN